MMRESEFLRNLSETSLRTALTLVWISPISDRLLRRLDTRPSLRKFRVDLF